ncbi:MAG TPA: hypothetical protein VK609_15505, partial [Mucilaginibacter sp.]|nr:hypothetical protein [Mucilaginibacter sp.]
MANSTISILNAKDSTLYKFGRASNDGSFKIDGLKPGKLILLVTYPDFADYVEHFTLELSKEVQDFGKIYMTSKARLLKEVIIKGKAASIKIKGDTTEYNAAAYVIQPNAKVEDLLKQLPGIQIDNDGKI